MTEEHFSTTKVSKCGHFITFFVIKPCKKYAGQEKCGFFLKQDPDTDAGSGFKILICRIRIRPKMDRIRNPDC